MERGRRTAQTDQYIRPRFVCLLIINLTLKRKVLIELLFIADHISSRFGNSRGVYRKTRFKPNKCNGVNMPEERRTSRWLFTKRSREMFKLTSYAPNCNSPSKMSPCLRAILFRVKTNFMSGYRFQIDSLRRNEQFSLLVT